MPKSGPNRLSFSLAQNQSNGILAAQKAYNRARMIIMRGWDPSTTIQDTNTAWYLMQAKEGGAGSSPLIRDTPQQRRFSPISGYPSSKASSHHTDKLQKPCQPFISGPPEFSHISSSTGVLIAFETDRRSEALSGSFPSAFPRSSADSW